MCGLVGMMGVIGNKEEKAFKDLLYLDGLRGPHSTGVVFVPLNGEHSVVKKAVGPQELFEFSQFRAGFGKINTVLMGHNRWATTGGINNSNAHPFEFDSVVGMHNGTLFNQTLLDDSYKFPVDSENIFYHMDINGVEDTVENLHGAFTLAWYDKAEDSVNFVRNKERPLVLTYSEDGKTLFWASEAWMIEVALSRHLIKHKAIASMGVGEHWSWKNPRLDRHMGLPKGHMKEVDMYVPPVIPPKLVTDLTGYNMGASNQPKKLLGETTTRFSKGFSDLVGTIVEFEVVQSVSVQGAHYVEGVLSSLDVMVRLHCAPGSRLCEKLMGSTSFWTGRAKTYGTHAGGYLTIDLRTVKEVEGTSIDGDIDDGEWDDIPDTMDSAINGKGELITYEEFMKATHDGCAFCSNPIPFEDWASIEWTLNDEVICKGCKDFEEVQAYLPNRGKH